MKLHSASQCHVRTPILVLVELLQPHCIEQQTGKTVLQAPEVLCWGKTIMQTLEMLCLGEKPSCKPQSGCP